ncbi:MAG TPA: ABC transporter permease, partial [Candidatus Acidoferrales bacterium]|nr:ABC transporter permease [Candidatus Acidoferrales bacterium]
CAVGIRIYMFSKGDMLSYVSGIENDPTSKVTHSVLPDGTQRTVMENQSGTAHITIDDHGYAGKHIEILDTTKSEESKEKNVSMGSMRIQALPEGKGERITIDTNEPEPFIFYAAMACFVALIIATVLGAPFARENDGHLEIALTKPVSRIALALETIGVDILGIVASWALTVVFLIACSMLFQSPHITFGANDFAGVLCGLAGGVAWYAILCAATSSMKRAYGIVLGLAWPFALIVFGLGKANLGGQPILEALHTACKWIGYILPFTYLHFGPAMTVDGKPAGSAAFSAGVEGPILVALAIGYVALAIFQWRRVEA